jgi:hypothetical protein
MQAAFAKRKKAKEGTFSECTVLGRTEYDPAGMDGRMPGAIPTGVDFAGAGKKTR